MFGKSSSKEKVNVKWFGARGDGLTDDTLSIIDAIEFTSINNMNLFFPSGTYLTEGIMLVDKSGVNISGEKGVVLKNSSSETKTMIKMTNCTDVSIQGLFIDCGWAFNRGIEIVRNCSYINLDNLNICNVSQSTNYRDQISTGLYLGTNKNENIIVSNVKINGVTNNDNGIIGDAVGESQPEN